MNNSMKWLVTASIVNLLGNCFGTILALQQNLTADWGGSLNGQNILQDFLGFKGTALSAPLSFLLIQLVITGLALQPARAGAIGVGGLTFIGLFYTLAQAGEPILLRQFKSGGFDPIQFLVLVVNIASAITMLVMGVKVWRTMRTSQFAVS